MIIQKVLKVTTEITTQNIVFWSRGILVGGKREYYHRLGYIHLDLLPGLTTTALLIKIFFKNNSDAFACQKNENESITRGHQKTVQKALDKSCR